MKKAGIGMLLVALVSTRLIADESLKYWPQPACRGVFRRMPRTYGLRPSGKYTKNYWTPIGP